MKLRTKILAINALALVFVLAAVIAVTSPFVLHSSAQNNFYLFVATIIGVGGVSILISALLLEAIVIRRVVTLTKKVKRIRDYRSYYEALQDKGSDEVAILANAINQMLQRIVNSTNEVGQLNQMLQQQKAGVEKTVAQRTEQLSAEKARLQASFSNLALGFIMTDVQGGIVLMNTPAQQILNAAASTPADSTHEWTIHDIDKLLGADFALLEKLNKSIRGGEVANYTDVAYHGRILRVLINPVLEPDNKGPLGSVIILEDVTDEKLLQRSREEFFSIASHELRTPLTAIKSNAALMKQFYEPKVNDQTFTKMVDGVGASSARLLRIVNDFLDVSQLEQGKLAFRPETFDVAEVLKDVTRELGGVARDKEDKITLDKTLEDLPRVRADKDRTKQIVYNLLGNALQHTDKGTITLSAQKEGNMLKVLVADTGRGIAAENQRTLFSKFKESSSTTERTGGTGLGLYLSQLLVNRMGGSISLERSEVGKGSTFAFTLPVNKS
jgi:signal transduction histidine kinase